MFATRGAEGATTRDLAKAAGITEPILYRHFPSKADLFAAVVARATERVLAGIAGIVAGARDATARLVALPAGGMCQYNVRVTTAKEVDKELIAWIKQAFEAAG